MSFGLSSNDWKLIQTELVEPMKKLGVQLWIFGSRARGDHKQFSDLDVLYKVPINQTLEPGVVSKIKEQIENSNLSIKVDLVRDTELAESYKESVHRDRVEV